MSNIFMGLRSLRMIVKECLAGFLHGAYRSRAVRLYDNNRKKLCVNFERKPCFFQLGGITQEPLFFRKGSLFEDVTVDAFRQCMPENEAFRQKKTGCILEDGVPVVLRCYDDKSHYSKNSFKLCFVMT